MFSCLSLGLIYQQNLRLFELAKALYRRLLRLELSREHGSWLGSEELHECKVRECDLLTIIKRERERDSQNAGTTSSSDGYEILNCWKDGTTLFPFSGLMLNELGNNYLQRGMHEAAFQAYSSAAKLGFFLALVNRASVLEIQGHVAGAMLSFQESISEAERLNLPHFHVRLRLATVLPRVLPAAESELRDLRLQVERRLDALLSASPPRNIENAAPINYGFSTGYYFAFHGLNNLALKQKMYRAYVLFCPALSYGHFASGADAGERYAVRQQVLAGGGAEALPRGGGDVYSRGGSSSIEEAKASGVGAVEVFEARRFKEDMEATVSADVAAAFTLLYWGEETAAEWEDFRVAVGRPHAAGKEISGSLTGFAPLSTLHQEEASLPVIAASNTRDRPNSSGGSGHDKQRHVLRVGFVSRFFFSHPVGFLYEEAIRILSAAEDDKYESGGLDLDLVIEVFMLEAKSSADPVAQSIRQHAHVTHTVSADLNELVDTLRTAQLDVLVYTDLGLDPVTYFAAFSRLAPVQVTGTLPCHLVALHYALR